MLIKLNDKNQEVSQVQNMLSHLGYDLIVDGSFGPKTDAAVKDFQTKNNLLVDGVVGDITYNLLSIKYKEIEEAEQGTDDKDYQDLNIIKYPMPDCQYNKTITSKNMIFIHFTAGGGSAKATIDYWDGNETRVATAYVIDRNDGRAYEGFNPDYWAWHLGVEGSNGKLDRPSVGIEICNYGPLSLKGGKYYSWANTIVKESDVYTLDKDFKGYKYYQKYTDDQLNNLEELILYLVKHFNIPVQKSFDETWFDYNPDLIKNYTPGIWTHTNVRKDKFDSYPDKRILEMLNRISKQINK